MSAPAREVAQSCPRHATSGPAMHARTSTCGGSALSRTRAHSAALSRNQPHSGALGRTRAQFWPSEGSTYRLNGAMGGWTARYGSSGARPPACNPNKAPDRSSTKAVSSAAVVGACLSQTGGSSSGVAACRRNTAAMRSCVRVKPDRQWQSEAISGPSGAISNPHTLRAREANHHFNQRSIRDHKWPSTYLRAREANHHFSALQK